MRGWNGTAHLRHISSPTLILRGDEDRAHSWPQAESLWRLIPNASLAAIPRCAHAVHSENPDVFNAIVEDFVQAAG